MSDDFSGIQEPVAAFSVSPLSGTAPLAVQFADASTGTAISLWNWSFGDGSWLNTTVAAPQVTHEFARSGAYTVQLTVCNAGGCNTTIPGQTITVTPYTGPVARLSRNVSAGKAPLTVRFGDQSTGTGISQRNWSFGDGSWLNTTAAAPQVTHVFSKEGQYNVRLTVCNVSGCNTTIPGSNIRVTPPPGPPGVKFAKNIGTGAAPLTVSFTDQSTGTGLNQWYWDFGDSTWFNTTIAAQKSPTHVYNEPGAYTVQLTVCNAGGCNTTIPGQTITADGLTKPVVEFAANERCGNAPLAVLFSDLSTGTGINRWDWSFGDDTSFSPTDAALKNPTHIYRAAGAYTVQLTACNAGGCNTTIPGQTITVTPYTGPVARLSRNVSSGRAPLTVRFGDQSTGIGINQRNWSFGDGSWFNTTAAAPQVTHVFAEAGVYTVRLTVCNATGCNTTIPGSNITVSVLQVYLLQNSLRTLRTGATPLTVLFTDQSTGSGLNQWSWDFGDDTRFNTTVAAQKSPAHVYNATGAYTVRLTVCNAGNCNTTIPGQTIAVVPPGIPVASFAVNSTGGISPPVTVGFTDTSTNSPASWSLGIRGWNDI